MRQYRGRRKDNGEWVYGWYVKDWEGGSHIVTEFGPDITHCWDCGANEQKSFKVDPKTVGQSTEVTDKHRVELYKGDIFHLGDPKILYEVIWVAAGFVGKQIGSYNSYVGLSHWQERIEVIGNRFDHPHLLKGA